MISPCQSCTNRHYKCHTECLMYKAYRSDIENIRQVKNANLDYIAYRAKVGEKIRKRGGYKEYAKK